MAALKLSFASRLMAEPLLVRLIDKHIARCNNGWDGCYYVVHPTIRMKQATKTPDYFKSLSRGLSLLQLFTPDTPEFRASDIVERLGVHKTTTYRMLSTLCDYGFLLANETTGKYSIGPAVYILGTLYQYTDDLNQAAGPVVRLINELTLECTNVGVLSGTSVVYMLREESKHDFRWSRAIGSTMPCHASALGKALLSGLSDSEIDEQFPCEELPRLTDNTVRTRGNLKYELEEVRRTGISYDPEGCIPLVFGFGSPIRGVSGGIVAALSLSVPVFRLDSGKRQAIEDLVRLGARLISYRLGYQDLTLPVRTLDQLRDWWRSSP